MTSPKPTKRAFRGTVTSVQPRIRLLRSFDQASHSYLGFVVTIQGEVGDEKRDFRIAFGKGTYARFALRAGDEISGSGSPVENPSLEAADLYRVTGVAVHENRGPEKTGGPPWQGVAPPLAVYRERGHRRLSEQAYETSCNACLWGCRMPVEIIIDQWKPWKRKCRFETFCYGPVSCPVYKAGPRRRVRGRKPGMTWEEPDWVDEEAVSERREE